MLIKITLANDNSQQHNLHYGSQLFKLEKTFSNFFGGIDEIAL